MINCKQVVLGFAESLQLCMQIKCKLDACCKQGRTL